MDNTCCWCICFSGKGCRSNWHMIQRGFVQVTVDIDANTHFDCPDFEFSYHQCQSCKRRSNEKCLPKGGGTGDDYWFHTIGYRDMFTECEHREYIS